MSRLFAPARWQLASHGAWAFGFAPVLYLALRGGGYDIVVYSEVGLAAWGVVAVGLLSGALSSIRIGRLGWVCLALLTAFTAWTAIAVVWSQSAESTVTELGRVATYLGCFALALGVVSRHTADRLVSGVGVAFALVSLLAVLSRLYPRAFPANQVDLFFPGSAARLNYPLNYSDGTGNFLAIGIPLLLATATRARTIAGRALGAAVVPVAVLGIVMTASRGAVVTATVAVVLFYALAPDRWPKLLTGLLAASGSAFLVAEFLSRHALRAAQSTPQAVSQEHQMTVLVLVVCAVVGLLQSQIGRVEWLSEWPSALRIERRTAARGAGLGVAGALVVAIAAGVPGDISRQWQAFKRIDTAGVGSGDLFARLGTVSGSYRYQVWTEAVDAFESKPLTGIGPGTYQFYWAQHEPVQAYVDTPHSLYLQALAESGPVGLGLVAATFVILLAVGVRRTLKVSEIDRMALAAATASLAAFCAAAAYDWMWQLPVAPVSALLLGAAILAEGGQGSGPRWSHGLTWRVRGAGAVVALAGFGAIAIPSAVTVALRASQASIRGGDVRAALADAATAEQLEPYGAAPRLQRALILERAGALEPASLAIAQATEREPTNWQLWLIRARIDAEDGHALAAVGDYARAHTLAPLNVETEPNARG